MGNYELTLTVQGDRSVRARTHSNAERSGRIQLGNLHRHLIGVFEDWLSQNKISQRRELEVFGTLLYQTLFSDEINAFFEMTLREVPAGGRLRVQLSFQEEAANLAALPWEYLYYPDTETRSGFFMATHVDLVLSRYLPLSEGRERLAPAESPLRILIVVSSPEDLDLVLAEPVVEAIEGLATQEPIKIDRLDAPTIDKFVDTLDATKPHVLHFMGHGRFNTEDRRGEIAFLNASDNRAHWVRDRDFAEFFVQMRSIPRLIFLELCQGGKVDFTANFAGLAPQLIRNNIQAVVAMQYPITNRAAIDFSRAFYRELVRGTPIDHAVQIGRWRITVSDPTAYDSRVFGTPVLYMHSRDGIIHSAASEAPRRVP